MAKDKGGNGGAANKDNVVALPTTCLVEKCGKKGERMSFCGEHFEWFKEGLVDKKGHKPTDFDKKYQAYMMKKKQAA